MNSLRQCLLFVVFFVLILIPFRTGFAQDAGSEDTPWVRYEGQSGPGEGLHIVLVSGDEEYRSEEALPMLGKILAVRHGFTCTVLFPIDPATGQIEPDHQTNIPGLEQLESADLMVLFTRFRELPPDQMEHIVDYTRSGRPIIGLRTATHAFQYRRDPDSPYAKYDWQSEVDGWEGGYGRQVLGETWVNHHGVHGEESTRGLVNGLHADRSILNGVNDIWGPTDVYGLRDIVGDETVLVYGQSLAGMEPTAPPNRDKSIMPIAWTNVYRTETGNEARVFTSTIASSVDFQSEDLRRLFVNAAYWAVGLDDQIPDEADVRYVDAYEPTFFGFDEHQEGLVPSDFALDRDGQ
jgi:hypothetical protein